MSNMNILSIGRSCKIPPQHNTTFKVFNETTYRFGVVNKSSNKSIDILEKHTINLNKKAKDGKINSIIGRTKEIDRMTKILLKRMKKNPLLIGEPGVGKTAIVEELARLISQEDVAYDLLDTQIYQLDVASLVAGTMARGDLEERVVHIIKALRTMEEINDEQIVLFIDEIHMLVNNNTSSKNSSGTNCICDILKPALARGQIQCIGSTTYKEYTKYFKNDAAFDRRFQTLMIDEPTKETTYSMLNHIKHNYETFHKCEVTDEALRKAIVLSDKYLPKKCFPDKAIDLIDEASSKCVINNYNRTKLESLNNSINSTTTIPFVNGVVDEKMIEAVVSDICGVNVSELSDEDVNKIDTMDMKMRQLIVGQDHAIDTIIKCLKRKSCGITNANRPICSMLFVGSTGVGKTECVNLIAEYYYGSRDNYIRFDMSEYMEEFSVSNLIGAPPGYVGYDEGGKLYRELQRKPCSVILFDEIEKAHPNVMNILLQILEDGVFTDSHKITHSVKNNIIIMTSNAIDTTIINKNQFGFTLQTDVESSDSLKKDMVKHLTTFFKPEFLNRIDEITVFNHLSTPDILSITEHMINDAVVKIDEIIEKNNYEAKVIITSTTRQDIVNSVLKDNYEYGARPLRKIIDTKILDKVSDELLNLNLQSTTRVCKYIYI